MTSVAPPSPGAAFSAFTPLREGFSQAIAPGPMLVTLGAAGATWWERDQPITAELPQLPVDGARWATEGKTLQVGLGTLDVAARAWRADPNLAVWGERGPHGEAPLRAVAWFADRKHVAMLLETADEHGARTHEIVIASAADGRERARQGVEGAQLMAATADRLIVGGTRPPVVLDLDARPIAKLTAPSSVHRLREDGGTFAIVGAERSVTLVRPADGMVIATWQHDAGDAVPVPGGVLAIDFDGNVEVACIDGITLRSKAKAASGVKAAVIRVVGDRVVVAGTEVRAATFKNPCTP